MKAGFSPVFNLIYVRSNKGGKVVGHFTLYNVLAWQFTLAEKGGSPIKKIALISNPEYPSRWSDDAATLFDIPFDWLDNPDYSDEMARMKARLEALYRHYVDLNQERAVSEIIDECIASLSLAPDQPLPAEQQDKLIKLATYRLGHYALGLPYVEPISSERIAEMVRKK